MTALVAAGRMPLQTRDQDADRRRATPPDAGIELPATDPHGIAEVSPEFIALLNDLRLDGRNGWTRTERPDGGIVIEKLLSTGKRAVFLLLPPGGGESRRLS